MKALKIIALIIGVGVLACAALAVLSSLGRSAQTGQSAAPVATAAGQPTVAEATSEATAVSDPTAPPSTIGKVGERREAGGVALTVMSVEKVKEIGTFQKAKEGKLYLLVEVLLETISQEAPYNPLYFKVKSADGFEYNVSISTADNTLKSGKLAAGEKVRGVVTFEVPDQAAGLVLSYEPIVLLGGYEPIRIALD